MPPLSLSLCRRMKGMEWMRAFCVARAPCSGHASASATLEEQSKEGNIRRNRRRGKAGGEEGRRRHLGYIRKYVARRPLLPSFILVYNVHAARTLAAHQRCRPPFSPSRHHQERTIARLQSLPSPSLARSLARSPAGLSARSQHAPLTRPTTTPSLPRRSSSSLPSFLPSLPSPLPSLFSPLSALWSQTERSVSRQRTR